MIVLLKGGMTLHFKDGVPHWSGERIIIKAERQVERYVNVSPYHNLRQPGPAQPGPHKQKMWESIEIAFLNKNEVLAIIINDDDYVDTFTQNIIRNNT